MKDIFEDGYIDHAIFQPAYLNEFYKTGFGQSEEAFALARANPGKLTYNHSIDPRNGEQGLDQLRADAEKYNLKRVKLHRRMARGVPRLEAHRPVGQPLLRGLPRARHQEIHVHKGPTIRPLDRDALNVADIDHGRSTSARSWANSSTGSVRTAPFFSSDYPIWTPKWLVKKFVDLKDPGGARGVRPDHDGAEEDPRAQRRQGVRH